MAVVNDPKPPSLVTACDDPKQKDPAWCRRVAEGLYCAVHLRDPWCAAQRKKRDRDRALLFGFVVAVIVLSDL